MFLFVSIYLALCGTGLAMDLILSEKVPMNDVILSEKVPMDGKFTAAQTVSSQKLTNDGKEAMERIVGGRNATCEEFPHQVGFVVNNKYFCGGFIVSDRYVVTAAHCAQDVDPSTVAMRIGSTWRKNGTKVSVTKVTPYPEYDNPPYDKDLAVMELAEPLEFNACTQPIALPPKGLTARYGEVMTVSGWGRTKQGATIIPDRLMAVNLTIVNHIVCGASYIPLAITENMLCAGNFFLGGKGTCQGDSGGVGSIDEVARGIVSFGRGCAQSLAPSVFTDISAPDMRDFINKHTGL